MLEYKEAFESLKEDLEMQLDSEHLKNNKVERLQPVVDKIIAKKQKQLEAVNYILEGLKGGKKNGRY